MGRIRLRWVSATALLWVTNAGAQVTFPQSPEDLVAMAASPDFKTSLPYREVVWSEINFAFEVEANSISRPYSDAIEAWYASTLSNPRRNHLFTEVLSAGNVAQPIDLYLLMGQDNMLGITESGSYHVPDETIRTALQASVADRTVATLNCALQGSFMTWWNPTGVLGRLNGALASASRRLRRRP